MLRIRPGGALSLVPGGTVSSRGTLPVGLDLDRVADQPHAVQRSVGGRQRYVVCVRYSARDFDGNYREARDHALVYVDGRLDHIVDKSGELCAGAVYAAFPELEKLTR